MPDQGLVRAERATLAARLAALRERHREATTSEAVAEVVERVPREQVDRLGRGRCALQRRAEPDVADLDAAVLGLDAQVGDDADRPAVLHDREEQRVLRRRLRLEVGAHLLDPVERPVRQVVPEPRVADGGRLQVGGPGGVERLEPHAVAAQDLARRG